MRGLGHEGIALVVGRLGQPGRIEFAVHRLENLRARIERPQLRGERLGGAFAGDIGLGDDQPVGEDRLPARLRRPGKRVAAGFRIDHRHHRLDMEHLAECAVGGEGLQDRRGIGEPRGLDHDALEGGDFAALALDDHAAQRLLQIAARDAAHAAIAEQHGFVGARAHQRVVDAGRAEFVDHHRGALPFRRR